MADIDWRFLLPRVPRGGFARVALWRAPVEVGAGLIESGTAATVSVDASAPASADAVVSLDASLADVTRASALLKPGGVLYLELTRTVGSIVTRDLRRLRRRLAAAGFEGVALYAVRGAFGGSTVYIPIDEPAAWRWYWRTLHQPRTARSWAWARGIRAAECGGATVRYLATRLAVTAVKADGEAHASPVSLLAHPQVARLVAPTPLSPLLLAGQRVVMFPFRGGERMPVAAIKIPKTIAQNEPTANEHHALHRLRRTIESPSDVPEPRLLVDWQGLNVAAEGVVRGESVERSCSRWGSRAATRLALLRAAAAWLTRFHQRTELRRCQWGSRELGQWLTEPLERYQALFGSGPAEQRLFSEVRQRWAEPSGVLVPVVHQHRDFRPANVLFAAGAIRVIDWEGCSAGAPLCDLLQFIVEWDVEARRRYSRAERIGRFEELFFGDAGDPSALAVTAIIGDYLRALDLDRRFVPLALVVTWTELAVRYAEHPVPTRASAGEESNESLLLTRVLAGRGSGVFENAPAGSLLHALELVPSS